MSELEIGEIVCEDCHYNHSKGHPDGKGVKPITRTCNGCGRDMIEERESTINTAKAEINYILKQEKKN